MRKPTRATLFFSMILLMLTAITNVGYAQSSETANTGSSSGFVSAICGCSSAANADFGYDPEGVTANLDSEVGTNEIFLKKPEVICSGNDDHAQGAVIYGDLIYNPGVNGGAPADNDVNEGKLTVIPIAAQTGDDPACVGDDGGPGNCATGILGATRTVIDSDGSNAHFRDTFELSASISLDEEGSEQLLSGNYDGAYTFTYTCQTTTPAAE
jgi:hypothetical protein